MRWKLLIFVFYLLLFTGCSNNKINVLERNINSLQEQVFELNNIVAEQEKKILELEKKNELAEKSHKNKKNLIIEINKKDNPFSLYNKGLLLFNEGRYNNAIQKFSLFIREYKDNDLADNSQYWIGESYLKLNKTEEALKAFKKVYQNYPLGNKVPDAYYKIGYIYMIKKNSKKAKFYFDLVIKKFPYTEPAKYAKNNIKKTSRR